VGVASERGRDLFGKIIIYHLGKYFSFGRRNEYVRGRGFFFALKEPDSVQSNGIFLVFTS